MLRKTGYLSLFMVLLMVTLFPMRINALDIPNPEDILDSNIPQSWYEAPKTASELGITEFHQSPMLEEKVASGELPPVEERLSEDPIILEPYNKIGKYGGTLETYGVGLNPDVGWYMLSSAGRGLFKIAPDTQTVYPWYVKDYDLSNDYTQITLYFRKGLKWSDGVPFIPKDEYQFYWEHFVKNKRLFDISGEIPLKDITFDGDYVVTLHIKPNPFEVKQVLTKSWTMFYAGPLGNLAPAHYMKQFHPDFVEEEKILKRLKEYGFNSIIEGYNTIREETFAPRDPKYGVPTMRPYFASKRTETELVFERNPYYFVIDPEGNQLPYIDRIRVNQANDRKTAEIKAVTGEVDFAQRILSATSIPLYKRNEDKGGYKTIILRHIAPSKPYYLFNFNDKNESYAKIFQDLRFRKAVSLAINRKELNERNYFNYGIPAQTTVPMTHKLFKEEYATAYADYEPGIAKELLDEMGMKDINGDGYREAPDGKEFKPTFMIYDAPFLGDISLHELTVAYWQDIGLNVVMDNVGGDIYWQRADVGNFDIRPHILDNVAPVFSPFAVGVTLAPLRNDCAPWPDWSTWVDTNGEQGTEPPTKYKDLTNLAKKYLETNDTDALEKLLEEQAKNLWVIGAIGYPPEPVIVKDRLKNIPQKGFYTGEGAQRMLLYNPMQWYLDE